MALTTKSITAVPAQSSMAARPVIVTTQAVRHKQTNRGASFEPSFPLAEARSPLGSSFRIRLQDFLSLKTHDASSPKFRLYYAAQNKDLALFPWTRIFNESL